MLTVQLGEALGCASEGKHGRRVQITGQRRRRPDQGQDGDDPAVSEDRGCHRSYSVNLREVGGDAALADFAEFVAELRRRGQMVGETQDVSLGQESAKNSALGGAE